MLLSGTFPLRLGVMVTHQNSVASIQHVIGAANCSESEKNNMDLNISVEDRV